MSDRATCTRADLDPACMSVDQGAGELHVHDGATDTPDKIFCYKPGIYDTTIIRSSLVVGPS